MCQACFNFPEMASLDFEMFWRGFLENQSISEKSEYVLNFLETDPVKIEYVSRFFALATGNELLVQILELSRTG